MNINTTLLPSRARALLTGPAKVDTYETTGGAVTAQFAAHNVSLAPPILPASVVHDNACGSGTIARAILTSQDATQDIRIHATDNDQLFLDALQADAAEHGWPVDVSNQRSEALSFPDDHFTHSFTNLGIFFTSSAGLDGAREIYRTLRPGGTAVLNCWHHVTWFAPLKAVHDALRPGKPYPAPTVNWSDGKQIRNVLLEAGFSEDEDEGKGLRVETSEAWARVPRRDLRAWAEKTWAYLGGVGGWEAADEERWDEAVDALVERLAAADGFKVVPGEDGGAEEVWMRASQWVAVATK